MKKNFFVFLGMSILLTLLLAGCTDGAADNLILGVNGPDALPKITIPEINASDHIRVVLNKGILTMDGQGRIQSDDLNPYANEVNIRAGDTIDLFAIEFSDAQLEALAVARPPYKLVGNKATPKLMWKVTRYRLNEEGTAQDADVILDGSNPDDAGTAVGVTARQLTTSSSGDYEDFKPLDKVEVELTIQWSYVYIDSAQVDEAGTTGGTSTWKSETLTFNINSRG